MLGPLGILVAAALPPEQAAAAADAATAPDTVPVAALPPFRAAGDGPPETLAQKDAWLNAIGWRLISGNAAYCEITAPRTGVLFEDRAAYGEGIAAPIFVHAIAPGSPASITELKTGEQIIAAGAMPVADLPFDTQRLWARRRALNDHIEAILARHAAVQLRTARGDSSVGGVIACAVRFEVITGNDRLVADAARVLIGEDFPGWAWPEDELAAAIAHETGHIVLDHIALVENTGRSRRVREEVEASADRMIPWLLANAGYDPLAAARFIERWQARPDLKRKRNSIYGQPAERQLRIVREAAYVEDLLAAGDASADWRLADVTRGPALRSISPPEPPLHRAN